MIRDEAEKLCQRLRDRFGAEPDSDFTADVAASDERIEFAAPGGARPHIIRYQIRMSGGGREAAMGIDECESLLDSAPADWDVGRWFQEIGG